ncbi:MAG: glcE [Marmoricola sp.]|nr:glcE [Marmoricola sp.]
MAIHDDLAGACSHLRGAGPGDAVDGVDPQWVVSPSTTAETAEVMRICARHDLAVVTRGHGTKLSWGRPPTRVDIILETTRMNQVVEHVAGDLVVVAQAGLRITDLEEHLGRADQHLSLDQPAAGATLGGTVATATSGPRRMGTGSVRDLIIGITMVRADGVVAKAGGKVVKNVAGYDLAKLLTGSFGTLAVITQVAFRLHHRPLSSRWVHRSVTDVQAARATVARVLHSQVAPVALEVDWPLDGPGRVAVLIEGAPAGIDERAHGVAALLGGDTETADDGPPWRAVYPWTADEVALKLTTQLSSVPDLLSDARRHGVAVRGSAGTGVLYGALPGDVDAGTAGKAVTALRNACVATGGSLTVLDAPADLKAGLDLWGEVHGLALMHQVKDQFDPGHRLSPGRFVGGI